MANFLSQTWLIDRRHALRAMGSCISLPFLECMVPLRAAEQQSAAAPRRSVFIHFDFGTFSPNSQITTAGRDYQFSRAFKPLEKFRDVITPISGMSHPGAIGTAHEGGKVWLTGGQIGPSTRNSISVDQKMAEVHGRSTRYPSLEISRRTSLAWTAEGVQLPALARCSEIFASLFETPKGGITTQRRELRQKGSILDANVARVRRLEQKMGSADKGRLDQYLTSIRDAEIRTRRADAWLDTPLPTVSDADRTRMNRDIAFPERSGDYFRTVFDLLVLAFQTDVTRVATVNLGDEPIPEIGIRELRHVLSHHGGDPDYMEKLTRNDIFMTEQFAYFLTRLSETKDLDGRPLLDSTMALFGSGMSEGNGHGNGNLPLVFAGGSGLGLKHGSHIDFNLKKADFAGYRLDSFKEHFKILNRPVNPDAHMSNLLLLMAQKMGVEIDRFGDSNGVLEV
jgi:hypothetical protein